MSSDYNTAGVKVGHNTYVLRDVVEDLIKGFYGDANERRHISASRTDLQTAADALMVLVHEILAADTAAPVYVPHPGYREV